jgi:hypothetical protein
VRDRIADELQHQKRVLARYGPHLFPAGQQKDGPQQISELSGSEQRGQRYARRDPLGGESERKVSDKQSVTSVNLVIWLSRYLVIELFDSTIDNPSNQITK